MRTEAEVAKGGMLMAIDGNNNRARKTYTSPQLIVHGSVEEITLGSGIGIRDFLVYGMGDPIGRCLDNSCNTGS